MSFEHSAARHDRKSGNVQLENDPIYRPPAAAKYLGLSESTLAKQRLRGDGPRYVKLTARAVGYRLSDLAEFLEANSRRSTSGNGTDAA